jgi:hypothetical protein
MDLEPEELILLPMPDGGKRFERPSSRTPGTRVLRLGRDHPQLLGGTKKQPRKSKKSWLLITPSRL